MKNKFKRILLKLSGEGLLGNKPFGIDEAILDMVGESIKKPKQRELKYVSLSAAEIFTEASATPIKPSAAQSQTKPVCWPRLLTLYF